MDFRVDVRDIRITHCATYLIKYIREHCVLPLFILLIYNTKTNLVRTYVSVLYEVRVLCNSFVNIASFYVLSLIYTTTASRSLLIYFRIPNNQLKVLTKWA